MDFLNPDRHTVAVLVSTVSHAKTAVKGVSTLQGNQHQLCEDVC